MVAAVVVVAVILALTIADALLVLLVGAAFGEPFVSREEIGLRSLRDLL